MPTAGTAGKQDALPDDPADPRLPGEPAESYAGYRAYRDLGFARDLGEAFRRGHRGLRGRRREQALTAWMIQTARWRWIERARAWDIAQAPALLRQTVARVEELKAAIAQKVFEFQARQPEVRSQKSEVRGAGRGPLTSDL
jgi:hypothetical protein